MREYEFVYIIQPDATPEREAEVHTRIEEAVTRGGGQFLLRDDWGKRKLAYEIQKFQKGHYFQVNFLGDGAFLPELERNLGLDSDVLRFLSVQANPCVKDVPARIEEAKREQEEREQRRQEREALEAERLARQAAAKEEGRDGEAAAAKDQAASPADPAQEAVGAADAAAETPVEE